MERITDNSLIVSGDYIKVAQKEAMSFRVDYLDAEQVPIDVSAAIVSMRARAALDFENATGDLFTVGDIVISKYAAGYVLIPVSASNLNQSDDFYCEVTIALGSQIDKYFFKVVVEAKSST